MRSPMTLSLGTSASAIPHRLCRCGVSACAIPIGSSTARTEPRHTDFELMKRPLRMPPPGDEKFGSTSLSLTYAFTELCHGPLGFSLITLPGYSLKGRSLIRATTCLQACLSQIVEMASDRDNKVTTSFFL